MVQAVSVAASPVHASAAQTSDAKSYFCAKTEVTVFPHFTDGDFIFFFPFESKVRTPQAVVRLPQIRSKPARSDWKDLVLDEKHVCLCMCTGEHAGYSYPLTLFFCKQERLTLILPHNSLMVCELSFSSPCNNNPFLPIFDPNLFDSSGLAANKIAFYLCLRVCPFVPLVLGGLHTWDARRRVRFRTASFNEEYECHAARKHRPIKMPARS